MDGRLSSLIRRIRNAVATCYEFCPEIEEKQKQSPYVAIFSQPNSNEDQSRKVLFNDFIVCSFIVRYMYFLRDI